MKILILQHPQENRETLSTVPVIQETLPEVEVKVGLSWRSFKALAGDDARPADWAVAYLGSGPKGPWPSRKQLAFVDKKGEVAPTVPITGVLLLDGTWSQVKTLWWRNAWLLKLNRLILRPDRPSVYSSLRREPRRECLSTLESLSLILRELGDDDAPTRLDAALEAFLEANAGARPRGKPRQP